MSKTPDYGVPDEINREWTAADFKKARPLKELLQDLASKSDTKQHKPAKQKKAA